MKLLIATTNPGKLHEFTEFLSDLPIELVSLKDIHISDAPEETGATYEDNAILKAKYYAQLSGLPVIADDGGFEIDALGGEPGVHSHRWIHKDREDTDEELIAHAMDRMKGIESGKRGAQLRTVIAFAGPNGEVHMSEGVIRGVIPETPSTVRKAGFPYRSLLYLPEIQKFYNHDELTPEETERYNHRKQALIKLKPIIKSLLS